MAQLLEGEQSRNLSLTVVSNWKKTEQAFFNAWTELFSRRINGAELSDVPALLVAKAEVSVETVCLEDNGHIGKNQRWPFIKPFSDAVHLSSLIKESSPALMSHIDDLVALLRIKRSLLLQGIIQTSALLDLTRFDNPQVGKDLEVGAAALAFGNGRRNIRLRRFSLPIYSDREEAFIRGSIGYYSVVRIREEGIEPREADCYSLIFAQSLSESIDFEHLLPWVLLGGSYAAAGDAYDQQERLSLRSQS